MTPAIFFGPSSVYLVATVFLILFTLLGAFDGLYFHIYKFKLQRLPEARLEHAIHAARGVLFVPIAALLFAVNSASWLLWTGLFLLALDIALEIVDVLVEKKAREFIGGIHPAESALHVTATAARVAALALVLSQKPTSAWGFSGPYLLEAFPPFLAYTGTLFAIGTGVGTLSQIWTMWAARLLISSKVRGYSHEGNRVEDYNLIKVHLSLPIAWAMEFLLRLVRSTVREEVVGPKPPGNAILYTFHRDALLTLSSSALTSLPNPGYIGYHGIASYFPTLHYSLIGIRALRFQKKSPVSHKEQIIRMLREWHGLALIRTDSGKPYGEVRASLIDLAVATGRPLVPVAQAADLYVTIAGHTVPLRNTKITTNFGASISAEDLAGMDREAARQLLQTELEALTPTSVAVMLPLQPRTSF